MFKGFKFIPINFIWSEPEHLLQCIKELYANAQSRNWIYEKKLFYPKEIFYPAPPSGGRHLPRFGIWQPSNMTFGSVMLSNYEDAMIQLMRHLNKHYYVRYFSSQLIQDYKNFGFCGFEHTNELRQSRVVHIIKNPDWEFFEQGVFLPFEKSEYYRRKKIAERLSPDIIIEYLKRLGWDLNDEAFCKIKGESWIVSKTSFN